MPGANRTWAVTLALLALSVRLAFFVRAAPWTPACESAVILQGDALGYHQIATTMLANHRFARATHGAPEALRTPGYPAFVAICYTLAGPRPWAAILAQIGLDVLIALLVGWLVAARLGSRVGAFAALAYSLDPLAIQHANLLLSETLFVFWIVLASVALIPALVAGPTALSARRAFAAGASIGAAILTRPVAVFLPLVLLPLVWGGREVRTALVMRRVAAWLLGAALLVVPWIVRNDRVFHHAEISTSGAYNLLVLQAAPVEADLRRVTVQSAVDSLLREADLLCIREHGRSSTDPFTQSECWNRLALRCLRAHSLLSAKHFATGLVFSFANVGTAGLAQILRIPSSGHSVRVHEARSAAALVRDWFASKSMAQISLGLAIGAYLACTFLLLSIGACRRVGSRAFGRWEGFCVAMILYFALVAGAVGEARFRLPAVPFYAGFIGLGAATIIDFVRRRGPRVARSSRLDSVVG